MFVVDNHSKNDSLENLAVWFEQTGSANKSCGNISYRIVKKEELDELTGVSELPRLLFIQNDTNSGFAAGNNLALRLLQNEDAYIWLLNPDMLVQENTLSELLSFVQQEIPDKSPGYIVGAEVRYYKGNHDLLFYGGGKVNFNFA
jgi:GT2 family glycosyltransferase